MKSVFGKINAHRGKRGNVMTPLNWMCTSFETALLPTAALNSNSWIGIGAFILASIVIIYYGAMYTYFSLKDPNRLQTELYNLESQQMLLKHATNDTIQAVNGTARVISSSSKEIQ